jgi:hypothetical protein
MPSTVIRALSYDDVTGTLFVTFVDGDLYAYLGVPRAIYDDFRGARSKGAYFSRKVRNTYPCRRMDEGGEMMG